MTNIDQNTNVPLTGIEVKFAVGSSVYCGYLSRLNEHGMFVRVNEEIPLGNTNKSCMVIIRGMLGRQRIEMNIKSSIVKITNRGVGLITDQLDEADKAVLIQLISQPTQPLTFE